MSTDTRCTGEASERNEMRDRVRIIEEEEEEEDV